MQFVDYEGRTVTGEVWSPGPVPRSVWVQVDGRMAAVKLGSAAKPFFHELDPRAVARTGQYKLEAQHRRLAARFAPPLDRKDWLGALGVASIAQLALED